MGCSRFDHGSHLLIIWCRLSEQQGRLGTSSNNLLREPGTKIVPTVSVAAMVIVERQGTGLSMELIDTDPEIVLIDCLGLRVLYM